MVDRKKGPGALRFGHLLRDRRRQLKLSQQEVADAAGIHRTLLSDYEREDAPERMPTDATLYGLAKALDVPEATIYEWAGVRPPTVEVAVAQAAPAELFEKLERLEALVAGLNERLDALNGGDPVRRRRPSR